MNGLVVVGFVLAAASGALARAEVTSRWNGGVLPFGTLAVNVTGSAALGALAGAGPALATVGGVALLGAFTTYSTFAREVAEQLRHLRYGAAAAYVVATLGGSVAAAAAGLAAAG